MQLSASSSCSRWLNEGNHVADPDRARRSGSVPSPEGATGGHPARVLQAAGLRHFVDSGRLGVPNHHEDAVFRAPSGFCAAATPGMAVALQLIAGERNPRAGLISPGDAPARHSASLGANGG